MRVVRGLEAPSTGFHRGSLEKQTIICIHIYIYTHTYSTYIYNYLYIYINGYTYSQLVGCTCIFSGTCDEFTWFFRSYARV